MDLFAPLVHEFTYQAMAHDLLPIKDGDKTTFHMVVNEDTPEAEEKDLELSDKDKVWVDNRHRHMKDTIDKLMGDFQKFLDQNPHFRDSNNATSLNAIKDMMAGLPQFQEMKETYSLHLTMAQESMNIFQNNKLSEMSPVEQNMATGTDEDGRKPKNVLEEVARLLDDDAVRPADRLRLIIMYLLYRDGVISEDIKRLLAHAALPQSDGEIIANLELLGGRTTRGLKDPKRELPPLFPPEPKQVMDEDSYLSRYNPAVKTMLVNLCKGTLDQTTFPYVKPPADPNEDALIGQGSLRGAKPSWAGAGRRAPDNKQRIIVFMAGGATFSEARACYEIGATMGREVVMATSHMLTPGLFVRQLGDLSVDKRRLDLPADRPAPRAPAHLFERPAPPPMSSQPPGGQGGPGRPSVPGGLPGRPVGAGPGAPPQPPTQQMGNMTLSSRPNGSGHQPSASVSSVDSKAQKPEKEKKKRHFLGLKKG